jgi:hypothetical protein
MKPRFSRAWLGSLAIAFLAGLLVGVPARLALQLAPAAVTTRLVDVEGTVWRGRARMPLAHAAPIAVEWTLAPSSLLVAAPRFALVLTHPLADYRGALVLRASTAELVDGTLRTSLGPLARFAGLPPGALLGAIDVQRIGGTLAADGIGSLACSGSISGVTVTGDSVPLALGDLGLECSDSPAGPAIEIVDRGGPLALQARVAFAPGWRYLVDGTAGARPGAPPSLAQALPLLGQAEGPDRVRFRYSGEMVPR